MLVSSSIPFLISLIHIGARMLIVQVWRTTAGRYVA